MNAGRVKTSCDNYLTHAYCSYLPEKGVVECLLPFYFAVAACWPPRTLIGFSPEDTQDACRWPSPGLSRPNKVWEYGRGRTETSLHEDFVKLVGRKALGDV